MRFWLITAVLSFALCAPALHAQSLVAETEPLTPEEQLATFHLPPGFEIQLVASEPDIHKPMNMKFDADGRLWVTHSLEYPYAATDDAAARDAITVFSDMGADGRAKTVRRFAEQLNIPIGLLPLGDREALAWSIPNIYRLRDEDGDGVAEQKSVVFGPFGIVDTHGNQNSFTRWLDGWVYANHGFNNDSRVKIGGVGDEVLHMNSGNTYRFRPDGSAIEQYSWGQVNPFGLSFDRLGNLYSADCHSSAVSLLLREGYYESFGKPHDGLGFAPTITTADHGGTGIAGVVYASLPEFPAKYRDVLFVGNVITNRIHCDRLEWRGSTPVVAKIEDFLTCDDPWFRPVDIQPGPDGALYVADFYNCIIGHYEVPLTHPKRDRERGRIWRIVYTGKGEGRSELVGAEPVKDVSKLTAEGLFELLAHPNMTVRTSATNYLCDKFPQEASALAASCLPQFTTRSSRDEAASVRDSEVDQACCAVWLLHRTSSISREQARAILVLENAATLQVHVVKSLGEAGEWAPWHFDVVRAALAHADPFVRRAAAESLAKHPSIENLAPLLEAFSSTDAADAQLRHQLRIALRDQLRDAVGDELATLALSAENKRQLVEFAAAAPTGPAATLIVDEALAGRVDDALLMKALPAAANHLDAERVESLVRHVEARLPRNLPQRWAAFRALAKGLAGRQLELTPQLRAALVEIARSTLAGEADLEWYIAPLADNQTPASLWGVQDRPCGSEGVKRMATSLTGGERAGGVLRSPTFEIPAALNFWMCGHDGLPNKPAREQNFVRLVLEDGSEAIRSYPPRDDVPRRVDWDLHEHAGKRGHVEVVDGLTNLDGFAWLAVSDFEPAAMALPAQSIGEQGAFRNEVIGLAGELKLIEVADAVEQIAASSRESEGVRLSAASAMIMLDAAAAVAPLQSLMSDAGVALPLREQAAQRLAQIDRPEARTALIASLKAAPSSLAVVIAGGLAGRGDAADLLLQEIEAGQASASLLLEPIVVERLKSSGVADVQPRIDALTADLSAADSRLGKLIAERRAAYLAGEFNAEQGRQVFAKSVCASCHRVGEVGSTIGPALDGIGNRGLDRLLEDVLDPSRNVDVAFRMSAVATDDGRVLGGFGLREENGNVLFHDSEGKLVTVPAEEIVDQTQSALSPMPSNVIEQIPEEEFLSLMAFLLSLR